MFKKIICAVVLVALSQASFAAKLAALNVQAVLGNADLTKSKFESLQKSAEYAQVLAQYEALTADLKALRKEAQTKGMTWSEAQKTENIKKEQFITQDLQLAQKKLQTERKVVEESVVRELQPLLQTAIKQVIDAEGLDIVLDRQAVQYANEKHDITKQVLEALNKLAKKK